MTNKPLIGVSSCLLGQPVRYDGGHKHARYITDELSAHFDFLPVCPEVAIGLGIPRPTIRLRRIGGDIRLVDGKDDSLDYTDRMREFADGLMPDLAGLSAYIFKKGSPSCGMTRVPVVDQPDRPRSYDGRGIFCEAFKARYPLVPTEEEGRLNDPAIRENFFERVFAWHRWQQLDEHSVSGFIGYHAAHKLMLMARGGHCYAELGRLVAGVRREDLPSRRREYIQRFMEIMAEHPDRGRQVNVLMHVMGYFKKSLDGHDKQELLRLFEAYKAGDVPLVAPLILLKHHLRVFPDPYLQTQHYLDPFPESLALRSVIHNG
ncbi:DUF523 and DUF1722 domain-containing protein [Granulosicoccaceae sp. 1_MG-2023]|nr:DUF523 and DUF1722 domain-containing protein [Granulosicoccaceae sp. 1_MG-2023]